MCGVVGIASRGPIDPHELEAATNALVHRGPDGQGIFVSTAFGVGLGHTRLSIIDLSDAASQPMHTADGRLTVSFNGEIYNFREVRRELQQLGHQFRTQSDTEVLLEAWDEWGPAALDKLNGMFAFAMLDSRSGDLFLARDALGVKPLYYVERPGVVAFASEIKALLPLGVVRPDLDPIALRRYLTFLWSPGERTPFADVKKLAPGAAMVVREGQVTRRWTWWTPPAYTPRARWSARDCAAELRDLIDQSVERQMISDAPLGSFLSGGLDSSAIVASARRHAPDIRCFTINTSEIEEGATDDLPYARQVAHHLGVRLDEVRVDARDLTSRVGEMVWMLDEPLADPACLNVLFISQLARAQGIKVLLSGAGGDDLFTGYRRHTMLSLAPAWSTIPAPMRRRMADISAHLAPKSVLARRLAKAFGSASSRGDRRISSAFAWGPHGVADGLMSPETARAALAEDVYGPLETYLSQRKGIPIVEKCLALEQRFFLADHNLIYTDKMAMAAGVETRVPLLDLELVRFAAEIPIEYKLRFLTPKWILKQSQRERLPRQVVDRPKSGFGGPLRRWLREDMRDMVEDLLSPRVIRDGGLFDPGAVSAFREADARGEVDGAYTLFSIMCLELWRRQFVSRAQIGGASATVAAPRR